MTYAEALAVVDAWRALSTSNTYAASFLAILDAMPQDDPENFTAAVRSLVLGLPDQNRDLWEVIQATGNAVGPFLPEIERPDFGPIRLQARPVLGEVPPPDVLDVLAADPPDRLDFADPPDIRRGQVVRLGALYFKVPDAAELGAFALVRDDADSPWKPADPRAHTWPEVEDPGFPVVVLPEPPEDTDAG